MSCINYLDSISRDINVNELAASTNLETLN